MQEHLQTIIAVLIATIIFYILPIYIAFEKKDDLAYTLALKSTTEFVEATRVKGYVSFQAYNTFVSQLAATSNIYEIRMEHKAKKFYPVINSYTDNTYKKILKQFDYSLFQYDFPNGYIDYQGVRYRNLKVASKEVVELYTEKQILDVINRSNVTSISDMSLSEYNSLTSIPSITNMYTLSDTEMNSLYVLNIGDEFNVIVRNKNTTMATIFFNMFTANSAAAENTRVYINYGGTVVSENYRDR